MLTNICHSAPCAGSFVVTIHVCYTQISTVSVTLFRIGGVLMRVTAIDPLLARLIAFLNFDFEAGKEAMLKKARLNFYELNRPGWKKRGAMLKEEIRLDLTPLLSATPTDEMPEPTKL